MTLSVAIAALVVALPPLAPQGSEIPPRIIEAAQKIVDAELANGKAYASLTELCDDVGNRLSGSPGAAKAVAWGKDALQRAGADKVQLQDVMVPKWVRGDVQEATIVAPSLQHLKVLALGGSIATPRDGITGDVIVVKTFDELKKRADEAKGKIVLFNRAMGELDENGKEMGYGTVVAQRTNGAVEAAKVGAIASVIRSVGTKGGEYRLPHTGMMRYEDGVKKIPHAALSAEDADLIARLVERRGKVTLNLKLSCSDEGTVPSSNVLGEITGRERPEEVVVLGGHLDSWDVGQGASDDGVGVVCSLETIRILKELNLRPKRTVRCVMFMNEENGVAGGNAYAKAMASELSRHVAALEMDSGAFGLEGLGVSAGEGGLETVKNFFAALKGLGDLKIGSGGGGADIGPMRSGNVPMLGVNSDGRTYFKYHHTEADTLDKVNPKELARHAAAVAAIVYALAEMDGTLPRQAPPEAK